MGPIAERVRVLRSDRAPGLRLPLALDVLRAHRQRHRHLPATVREGLRGIVDAMASEDGGSPVRPRFLRNRVRETLLPRDPPLRDKGDDTEDTTASRTTPTGDHPRPTAVLSGHARSDEQREHR